METVAILGMTQPQLQTLFADWGEPRYRAQQLVRWIHGQGIIDFEQMTDLGKTLRQKLQERATITLPIIEQESHAIDGTVKWLLKVDGGSAIEAVLIPEKERTTLCVSSQVGCILNCSFCHTGKQGFQRNLTPAEIIGQLWIAQNALITRPEDFIGIKPVTNVVFMGMGEPLLNYEAVKAAITLMRDDVAYGLSKRRITLSTSGVVPTLYDFIEETDCALAVSLHAPTDELRDILVPINRKYPLVDLLKACRAYIEKDPRRHVTMEYVMLDGVNDTVAHAKALVRLLQGIPVKVNLIPFNSFDFAAYKRSSDPAINAFKEYLLKAGVFCFVRKTRGDDKLGACGQLAGRVQDKTRRSIRFLASQQAASAP